MIFGRKKDNDSDQEMVEEQTAEVETLEQEQDRPEAPSRALVEDVQSDTDEASQSDEELPDELDPSAARWSELDESRDWREDGPFDLEEVDLDADDIERLDFGSLIMTPFDDMQLQLQIEEATQQVNAALVMHGQSALEIALFGAPAQSSMAADVRLEMVTTTNEQGGQASLAEGPFGTEIRRIIPMQGPEGEEVYHISRTWFVQGPRWLLRGVLMGEAGMHEGVEGPSEVLYEFFRNLVVRRDQSPRVPGDLIPMSLPAELVPTDDAVIADGADA